MSRQRRALTRYDLAMALGPKFPALNYGHRRAIIDDTLDEIRRALCDGESLTFIHFGRFDVLTKRARPGRNPKTGEPAVISARRTVSFYPAKALLAAVEGVAPPAKPKRATRDASADI